MGIHIMTPLYEIVIKPGPVKTLTIVGSTSDAYMSAYPNVNYNTVRNATSGSVYRFYPSATNLDIGQWLALDIFVGWVYSIYRAYLFFNTLPLAGKTIVSAKLKLWSYGTTGAFGDLVVVNGQPTYPSDPVVLGDYDRTLYSGDGGSILSGDMVNGQYNDLVLNSSGRSWINKSGWTKLCLRDSKDIAGTPPSGVGNIYDYWRLYSAEAGLALYPLLEVKYR